MQIRVTRPIPIESSLRVARPASLETLEYILGSDSPDRFVAEVLGKRFLLCRGDDPDRFQGLLTTDVLETVLGSFGLRGQDIRLVQLDREIRASEYSWRDGLVDPFRVSRLFSEGATVVFGSLQDRHEPLRRLCAGLTEESGSRTQTNVYLTPPGFQGFRAHWDTHDVFVLQVSGSKRWRMYDGGPEQPLPHQKFDPEVHEPGPIQSELTLSAGDTLYIPRGVMHAAESTDEMSLHITLGLMPYSWADLLADCLMEIAERSPDWRANVPFGFASGGHSGLAETRARFLERLAALRDEVDVETVLAARLDLVGAAHRPRAHDFLAQAADATDLSENHVVESRPGLAFRIEAENGRVVVLCGQRRVDFPTAALATLEAVLGKGPSPAGSIGDGLDWASRRVVLTTLIREGFVTKRPGSDPSTIANGIG
jgi:ribosomal protein L16 Arg81 hydroxylase